MSIVDCRLHLPLTEPLFVADDWITWIGPAEPCPGGLVRIGLFQERPVLPGRASAELALVRRIVVAPDALAEGLARLATTLRLGGAH